MPDTEEPEAERSRPVERPARTPRARPQGTPRGARLAFSATTAPTATTGSGETEHIASGIDRGVWAALDVHAASRLAEVEAALRRLEEHAYGACERCAGDIADSRLDARPEVRFCLPCQQREEAERRVLQPQ